ncbi:exonuclease domain-containing protein [Halobacteriovorax sp.]|uniref:exonuclease domain-containing protein n=1 Tax=Halobacteriovorax sp. TaxID=2020862 RepID=UPI0035656322
MAHFTEEERAILLRSFPNGIIALDLEMTGLSPLIDRVIEIAAVKVTPFGEEIFDELIDPQIDIPQFTIDIHGITNDMVQGKRTLDKVLPDFIKFIGSLPLVAHNAKFDSGFIVFGMHQNRLPLGESHVYCSCKFSRYALRGCTNYKLATLTKELEIPLENHHRALDDAIACLKVYERGLKVFKKPDRKILNEGYLFKFKDFDKQEDFEIPKKLQALQDKVKDQEMIEIKYRGGSLKNQFRPVRPISFLPMPQGNMLYAHCLVSDMYKSFSLKKISELRELDESEKKVLREKMDKK